MCAFQCMRIFLVFAFFFFDKNNAVIANQDKNQCKNETFDHSGFQRSTDCQLELASFHFGSDEFY